MKTTKKPYVVELKVVSSSIHMVDVNMAITKSKVVEKHVFKDKKFVDNWEEEKIQH